MTATLRMPLPRHFIESTSLQIRDRMLCETMSNTLQKSRKMTSVALSLSTGAVTPSQKATKLDKQPPDGQAAVMESCTG